MENYLKDQHAGTHLGLYGMMWSNLLSFKANHKGARAHTKIFREKVFSFEDLCVLKEDPARVIGSQIKHLLCLFLMQGHCVPEQCDYHLNRLTFTSGW